MHKTFLADSLTSPKPENSQPAPTPIEPHPETVKITITGSPTAVDAILRDLHSRRFAEFNDWCPPMPTGRPGEIIRVLLKRVWL
jgi:hypothetical protein